MSTQTRAIGLTQESQLSLTQNVESNLRTVSLTQHTTHHDRSHLSSHVSSELRLPRQKSKTQKLPKPKPVKRKSPSRKLTKTILRPPSPTFEDSISEISESEAEAQKFDVDPISDDDKPLKKQLPAVRKKLQLVERH